MGGIGSFTTSNTISSGIGSSIRARTLPRSRSKSRYRRLHLLVASKSRAESPKTPEKLQSCADAEVAPSRKHRMQEKAPQRRDWMAESNLQVIIFMHGPFQETDGVAACAGAGADFKTADCKAAGGRAQRIGQSMETRSVERGS